MAQIWLKIMNFDAILVILAYYFQIWFFWNLGESGAWAGGGVGSRAGGVTWRGAGAAWIVPIWATGAWMYVAGAAAPWPEASSGEGARWSDTSSGVT